MSAAIACSATQPCPCGFVNAKQRAVAYGECCARWIEHFETTPAPDAQQLMRSRYSAFVLEDANYLRATWHSSTRPEVLDFEDHPRWLGLEVREHVMTGTDSAEVEFVARYRASSSMGRAVRLHECSRFVREDGRWFYVDGDQF